MKTARFRHLNDNGRYAGIDRKRLDRLSPIGCGDGSTQRLSERPFKDLRRRICGGHGSVWPRWSLPQPPCFGKIHNDVRQRAMIAKTTATLSLCILDECVYFRATGVGQES